MHVPLLLVSFGNFCPADEYTCHQQDLRKRLDVERNQKEQYARQLTAVKEEVTAAQHSAQEEAAVAHQQVQSSNITQLYHCSWQTLPDAWLLHSTCASGIKLFWPDTQPCLFQNSIPQCMVLCLMASLSLNRHLAQSMIAVPG